MAQRRIPLVIHSTHEAGFKLGGIGAVLDGMLSSSAYNAYVDRTILVGPINPWNPVEMQQLTAPGNGLRLIYSSIHGVNNAPEPTATSLRAIEEQMNVRVVYGVRTFGSNEHEVILVDAGGIAGQVINSYKYYLWQHWRLSCVRHEQDWEFSFYLNAGEPLYAAVEAITADMSPSAKRFIIAHEWLGLPMVFSALLREPARYKTIFYAHEVATARLLVEGHAGHDTRFYNALRLGLAQGFPLEQIFGDQSWFYKHDTILRAGVCDRLLAVGDSVVDELRFLGGAFRDRPVDLVYNGVPATAIGLDQKLASRELLRQYAQNLLGYRPDYVFTHVARMVVSKALWRDLRVLEHLEWTLAAQGRRAVLFIVSTSIPAGRRCEDIHRWEGEYGWPIGHRADNGDLQGGEVDFFFNVLEPFHWGRQAIRVVLVNQFGWERERCGRRMPEAMGWDDLRVGTDLEFGQSIYEPFGIAEVEPLGAGAVCLLSNVCGCLGFIDGASQHLPTKECTSIPQNLIVADYVSLPPDRPLRTAWDALGVDRSIRDTIEAHRSYFVAQELAKRLPRDERELQRLLMSGQQIAARMSWEVVVTDYLLPALWKC